MRMGLLLWFLLSISQRHFSGHAANGLSVGRLQVAQTLEGRARGLMSCVLVRTSTEWASDPRRSQCPDTA